MELPVHTGRLRLKELCLEILEILREYNVGGKALRPIEIRRELEKRRVNASLKSVVGCLDRFFREGRVVKYKAGRGRRGSPTYYALKEYSNVLDRITKPKLTEEHITYVAEGLRALYKLYHGFYEYSSIEEWKAKRELLSDIAWKAYRALQHILRGDKYRHLRDTLDRLRDIRDRLEEELLTKKMITRKTREEISKIEEKIATEAYREADILEQYRKDIMSSSEKAKLTYGSCDICGLKPTREELEKLREWWKALELNTRTGFNLPDVGPKP